MKHLIDTLCVGTYKLLVRLACILRGANREGTSKLRLERHYNVCIWQLEDPNIIVNEPQKKLNDLSIERKKISRGVVLLVNSRGIKETSNHNGHVIGKDFVKYRDIGNRIIRNESSPT